MNKNIREIYVMNRSKIEEMVEIVLGWYNEIDTTSQQEFKLCSEDDLVTYHSTLGRDIRNQFKLWVNYIPEMYSDEDGLDNHPDEISMQVIKEVWKKLQ